MLTLLLVQALSAVNWDHVNQHLELALAQRLFPAAYLAVSVNASLLLAKTYGTPSYQSTIYEQGMLDTSLGWDLGELTSQLSTVAVFMRIFEDNKTHYGKYVTDYIAAYSYHLKENTTLDELLLHNSGLPQHYNFSHNLSYSQLITDIAHLPPTARPGTKPLYSNLNYIILGECIRKTFVYPSFRQGVFQNLVFLGLDIKYNPDPKQAHTIAPSAYNTSSGSFTRGVSNDPLLPIFGGVGPYTGLFGAGADVLRFMHILQARGKLHNEATRYYKEETVLAFTTKVSNSHYNNTRARGFETKPLGANPPCGHKMSEHSFGMNSSTGSYAWSDPSKNLTIVLLSNGGMPTGEHIGLDYSAFQSRLSDLIYEAVLE